MMKRGCTGRKSKKCSAVQSEKQKEALPYGEAEEVSEIKAGAGFWNEPGSLRGIVPGAFGLKRGN